MELTISDHVELLFFDTFAHDNTEELNLDLVQFPKPVYVTEVRIIPLGARVQADFPGGVRLGATNPSQFKIEFFVNDLGKPGASTFETLGGFQYDQNGCINLDCVPDETIRKIPTDGLVLRGWYTTITLAVYGTLTKNITEQIVQPVVNPALPTQPNTIADAQQIISSSSVDADWQSEPVVPVPVEFNAQASTSYQPYTQPEPPYNPEFGEYYNDVPKDPRSYHHTPEPEWESKGRTRSSDTDRDRERDRGRDVSYSKSTSLDRPEPSDRRDREKRYSRSQSRDRQTKDYRDRDHDWDHDRSDYRDRDHDWDRDRGRERDRDRYKHDDNYRRYNRDEREERKRPRTPPPMPSPKRPHTPPHSDHKEPTPPETENLSEEEVKLDSKKLKEKSKSPAKEVKEVHTPPLDENVTLQMDVEEFEPILSDEDILDDGEHYQDVDYDYSTYTNNDDIIKLFTPGVSDLLKYNKKRNFKTVDGEIIVDDALLNIIAIADDYFKSSITKYEPATFKRHNKEIKEEFIHLCEKLISTVGPSDIFCDIIDLFGANLKDVELKAQVQFIVDTIIDWLKIALTYEMANAQEQPAYKIRHIKCGVRLAEWCATSAKFIEILWQQSFNMHKILLSLYEQEFMALSIKLMVLKALDTYLLHKFAVEKFLQGGEDLPKENGYHDNLPVAECNGYKILVKYIRANPLVRIKFSLNSILKKLNLYEVLDKLSQILSKSSELSPDDLIFITKSLEQIAGYIQSGTFVVSQPKRFLPVSEQFEFQRNINRADLTGYFQMFNLLQCFVVLLSCPATLNLAAIRTNILEMLARLQETSEGLRYLANNTEAINLLLKCLLKSEEELQLQYALQGDIECKSHNLGLQLSYKLQGLYHIDSLMELGGDFENGDVIDQLHPLLCLTFTNVGKVAIAQLFGLQDNVRAILQYLEVIAVNSKEKSESLLGRIKKSTGLAYIIDLLSISVKTVSNVALMEKHSKLILQIINLQELFEDSVAVKLNELRSYFNPFENVDSLSYDNIAPYLENIEKLSDNIACYPGSLITSLRIIEHLGIPRDFMRNNNKDPYVELKYKHVILQLFSLDGTTILIKLLQKICDYYEQPSLHTSVFVSNLGLTLMNVIQPTVALLKQMFSYVIQCHNTNFKDITAIPTFLQTFNLLNSFPTSSQMAQTSKTEIIDILLTYTQPLSDQDSLSRTLWAQMCGEVLKYITSAPHVFIAGLLIFSEILPLPLPIQTKQELSQDEINWNVNVRKLWSAHLHGHCGAIQEMVNRLCISTQPQLLNLLRRICVQLADLAANAAVIIARGILDSVFDVLVPKEDMKLGPCNSHVARLLNFFACLVTHSTIKCAVLSLLHPIKSDVKSDDKYSALIGSFVQVLKINCHSNSHIQSQECILSIIQSFCDVEITLVQNPIGTATELSSEVYLANSLPVKEHLLVFIGVIVECLSMDCALVTYLPIIRTLLLLTEHDYGFYHLREALIKKPDLFGVVLGKLAGSFLKNSAEYLSALTTLIEFLRVSIVATDEVDATAGLLYATRRITLAQGEVKGLVGWIGKAEDEEKVEEHALQTIREALKKAAEEDNSFETLVEGLDSIITFLEVKAEPITKEAYSEVILPLPETLLVQFAARTVFTTTEAMDERLTSRFWLALQADDGESELETVNCDLLDICRQNLPQDYNLIKDVEKICRISRSENSDDKEKRIDDQKSKMKKPFITPVRARGFARTVQQRPDLFRSRPPNTSRPPSLHVDDFVALETCGAQPTGPTGYNKISRELLASNRIARGSRGRSFVTSERSVQYRQMSWWGSGLGRGPYQL